MGGNYYCEYCDKTFRDVLAIRKNHLKGALHIQNRKEHYDRFRDIQTFLKEEAERQPCPRLLKNLDCNFGSRCRYSHYMPWELQSIERIQREALAKQQLERDRKLARFQDPEKGMKYWTYNDLQLSQEETLPPSLRKWPTNNSNCEISDWG